MKQIKTIMSLFCAAALFAACSSTDDLEPVVQTGQLADTETVGFDVYTRGSMHTTRAGYVGDINETAFQATGFGVYAYVSRGGNTWTGNSSAWTPDFMTNQHITYSSSAWTYSPVKYWPNHANSGTDTGDEVDGLGGGTATTTEDIDYVSFFAYGPYVEKAVYESTTAAYTAAITESGDPATYTLNDIAYDGILSLPANNASGDPKIAYLVSSNPAYSVDLMYGVAARDYTAKETTGGIGTAVKAGNPFLDLTKQVVGDKISYQFKHALTKLGVNVDAYFDEVRGVSHTNDVDANTRIVIESISIDAGSQKLYYYGELNLNNYKATPDGKPNWGNTRIEVSDLSKNIATGLKWVDKATILGGSPTAEEYARYFAVQPLGVTKNKQSLFGKDITGTNDAALMFIPGNANASGDVSVEIKYHVITRDANLGTGWSDVTNHIKNKIGSFAFSPGSNTIINLHLGMTTMKFDAQVAEWDGSNSKDVDLPANVAVESLTKGTSSIGVDGSITLNGATATITGSSTPVSLTETDVYFTTDADGNEVLPVEKIDTKYYIPSNYTNGVRSIYMWYGGKKDDTPIEQAKSTATVAVSAPSSITAAATEVTLTVTATDLRNFDCNDWTLTATSSPEGVTITPGATDNTEKTFKVTVSEAAATRTITFTLTHKDGLVLTTTKEQTAP